MVIFPLYILSIKAQGSHAEHVWQHMVAPWEIATLASEALEHQMPRFLSGCPFPTDSNGHNTWPFSLSRPAFFSTLVLWDHSALRYPSLL